MAASPRAADTVEWVDPSGHAHDVPPRVKRALEEPWRGQRVTDAQRYILGHFICEPEFEEKRRLTASPATTRQVRTRVTMRDIPRTARAVATEITTTTSSNDRRAGGEAMTTIVTATTSSITTQGFEPTDDQRTISISTSAGGYPLHRLLPRHRHSLGPRRCFRRPNTKPSPTSHPPPHPPRTNHHHHNQGAVVSIAGDRGSRRQNPRLSQTHSGPHLGLVHPDPPYYLILVFTSVPRPPCARAARTPAHQRAPPRPRALETA